MASHSKRYPELAKLPKSRLFTSIQWRHQTPGSLDPFFRPDSMIYGRDQFIDPSHPAARVATRFPNLRDEVIGVKMRPIGLLLREQRPFPAIPLVTWTERVQWAKSVGILGDPGSRFPKIPSNLPFKPHQQLYPEEDYNSLVIPAKRVTPRGRFLDIALEKATHRVPISLHVSTSKKRMGQDRYMRKRIETRLRAALNLIMTRGAGIETDSIRHDVTPIVFSDADAGKHWVVQGWAYMFYPTSEVYNMPYATLIMKLRSLLSRIINRAIQMEHSWLNQSLLQDQKSAKPSAPASGSTENDELSSPDRNKERRMKNIRLHLPGQVAERIKAAHAPMGDSIVESPLLSSLDGLLRIRKLSAAPTLAPEPPKASTSPSSKVLARKDHDVWEKELSAGLTLIRQRAQQEQEADSTKPDTSSRVAG